MFNSKNKKEIRMMDVENIGEKKYNGIIGATLLYGFILNILLILVARNFFMSINPIVLIIGYFIFAIGGSFIVNLSSNPAFSFLGYNMICIPIGGLLAICVPEYPMESIIAAVATTAIVTGVMIVMGTIFKNFFSKLGTVLIASLFIAIIAELITMLFGYGGDIFNWIFVVIFSLYIGYDWYKAQQYPKTVDNAIDSAVDLYLDIINLFIRLLEIFSKAKK